MFVKTALIKWNKVINLKEVFPLTGNFVIIRGHLVIVRIGS